MPSTVVGFRDSTEQSVPYIQTFKLWTFKDSNVCSHIQSRVWYMLLHDCAFVCFTVRHCIQYSNTLCLCQAQMSGSNCESSGDIASTSVVFKVLSVQFSHSVMSNSLELLRPHGLQHARPPCPPTPGAYSDSCPLSRWCHPTISSSVIPFSSCLQSFPASWSFQMSQLFTSGGQRVGALASASVLPMNTQDWFPLGWTGWISLQSKGLSRVFSNTTVQKHQFFGTQLSLVQVSCLSTATGKTIALTRLTFVGKLMYCEITNIFFVFLCVYFLFLCT